jgi:hypothetical protein
MVSLSADHVQEPPWPEGGYGQFRVDAPQREVSIGLLKVIENEARCGLTPVAPFAGFIETTVALVCGYAQGARKQRRARTLTEEAGARFRILSPWGSEGTQASPA